MQTSDFRF